MKPLLVARLVVENLKAALQKLESRVAVLEKAPAPAAAPCAKVGRLALPPNAKREREREREKVVRVWVRLATKEKCHGFPQTAPVQAAPAKQAENGDDDDFDLFGSDEEDEEAARIKQERLDAYAAKKSKKPALIAKSSILLDVKPVRSQRPYFPPQVEEPSLLCSFVFFLVGR